MSAPHHADLIASPPPARVPLPSPQMRRRGLFHTIAAIQWPRRIQTWAFIAIHLTPIALLWTGVTLLDLVVCAVLYVTRMFFVTAGYHRYFAHRSYKLGRLMQAFMAIGGTTAIQKGVLWWAATHRHHHKHSDQPGDVHSPRHGLFWSHVGWVIAPDTHPSHLDRVKDLARYPELVWLDRYHLVPPVALGLVCFLVGGWSMLVGGFFLSTILLWHGTFTINSLSHVWGKRPYATRDDSRNNVLLALITLGEGWHNNHHRFPSSTRQGFHWWQVDLSFYVLRVLGWLGLARDLRGPPPELLETRGPKRDEGGSGGSHATPRAAVPRPTMTPLA